MSACVQDKEKLPLMMFLSLLVFKRAKPSWRSLLTNLFIFSFEQPFPWHLVSCFAAKDVVVVAVVVISIITTTTTTLLLLLLSVLPRSNLQSFPFFFPFENSND